MLLQAQLCFNNKVVVTSFSLHDDMAELSCVSLNNYTVTVRCLPHAVIQSSVNMTLRL